MLIAYDDGVAAHLSGAAHPEASGRVAAVAAELARRGMCNELVETRPARPDELARVHPPAYVELVRRVCSALAEGEIGRLPTGDTDVDAASFEAASRAAGAALCALDRVDAESRAAFALVRPPGHHAEPSRGMGFCVFNHAALAARTAAIEGGRALVFDFDYHHGNGTQACVGGGVSYYGSHASPAYPGTGDARENRIGPGGALVNVPLDARGISTEAFIALHARTLRVLAERVRPTHLIVSAGYDVLAGDPVGDLGVEPSFARQMGRLIREIADTFARGRTLFVLEGGYDPAALADGVAETIAGYEDGVEADIADERAIPPAQRALVRQIEEMALVHA